MRPRRVFIKINTFVASFVATGNSKESIVGTSFIEDDGEVGRDGRFTSRRPPLTDGDFFSCGEALEANDGNPCALEISCCGSTS